MTDESFSTLSPKQPCGIPSAGCTRKGQRSPVSTMGRKYKVFYHTCKPLKGKARESAWFKNQAYAEAALKRMEAKYGEGAAVIYVD